MTRILSLPSSHATARRQVVPLAATPVRAVSSQALLEGGRELVIRHQGGEYHLRLTRNDKLILTK